MKEKDWKEALKLEDEMIMDANIEKTLKKSMCKQINGRVYKILLLTVVGAIFLTFGISFTFDQIFYDPSESSPYLEQEQEYSKFHLLMDIYIGMNYPGRVYVPNLNEEEEKGFGAYEIRAKVQDAFYPLYIDGKYTTTFEVKRNKLEIYPETDSMDFSITINEFLNDDKIDEYNAYLKDMHAITLEKREEIALLPDSAVIQASLSFPKTLTLEETLEFIRTYEDSDFSWIALDSEYQYVEGVYDGINLVEPVAYEFTEECQATYPSLMIYKDVKECTAEELEECYRSRAAILLDNPDFLKMMYGSLSVPNNVGLQKQLLENRFDAAETELRALGVCAYVTKQDFLDMIDSGMVQYAVIEDVKVSTWSK